MKNWMYLSIIGIIIVAIIVVGIMFNQPDANAIEDSEVEEAFSHIGWNIAPPDDALGAFRPINFKTTLAQRLSDGGTDTTIDVSSVATVEGETLTMTMLGDIVFLMIDSGTDNWELVSCTTLTTTQFGGCTRGYVSYEKSTATARKRPHSPGATIIITNDDHYLTTQYPTLDSESVWAGQLKFENASGFVLGPEDATSDNCMYFGNTSPSIASSYICYDPTASTSGGITYSFNGSDSYIMGVGDASFSAGNGIDISASVISALLATNTPSMYFDEDGLQVLASETMFAFNDDGLELASAWVRGVASGTGLLAGEFLPKGSVVTMRQCGGIELDTNSYALYHMDGLASTTTKVDNAEGTNTRDLIETGAVDRTDGWDGEELGGYNFNAQGEYLTTTLQAADQNDLTYSAYMRTTSTTVDTDMTIIGNADDNNGTEKTFRFGMASDTGAGNVVHLLYHDNNVFIDDIVDMTGTTALNDGEWHFIEMTIDNSSGLTTLYVDGVSEATQTVAAANDVTTGAGYTFGASDYTFEEEYEGDLDEIRVDFYLRDGTKPECNEGYVKLARATDNNMLDVLGIMTDDVASSSPVDTFMRTIGEAEGISDITSLTEGLIYYLSDTSGTLSTTPGTWSKVVCSATGSDNCYLNK